MLHWYVVFSINYIAFQKRYSYRNFHKIKSRSVEKRICLRPACWSGGTGMICVWQFQAWFGPASYRHDFGLPESAWIVSDSSRHDLGLTVPGMICVCRNRLDLCLTVPGLIWVCRNRLDLCLLYSGSGGCCKQISFGSGPCLSWAWIRCRGQGRSVRWVCRRGPWYLQGP